MSAPASYKYTFAVVLTILFVAGGAYVVASTDALRLEYLGLVVLAGCVAVIVRVLSNVVLYERVQELKLQSGRRPSTPLTSHVATSCPDFWLRSRHEVTGGVKCVNRFGGDTLIGSASDMEVAPSVPQDPQNENWVKGFCDALKTNPATAYPHVVASKMCEYADHD